VALPALPGVSGSDRLAADRANAAGPGKAFSAYGPLNLVVYGALANPLTTTGGDGDGTFDSATGLAVGQAINSANVPPGTTIGALAGADPTFAFPPQYWSGRLTPNSAVISDMRQPAALATLVGATIVSPFFAAGTTVASVDQAAQTITMSAAAINVPAANPYASFEFQPDASVITVTGEDEGAFVTGAAITFDADFQIERSFDGGATWILCNVGGTGMLAQYTSNTPVSISFGDPEQCVLYRLNVTALTPVANTTIHYRISTTGQASTTLSVPAIS
jgi:hypothetical protein